MCFIVFVTLMKQCRFSLTAVLVIIRIIKSVVSVHLCILIFSWCIYLVAFATTIYRVGQKKLDHF